jgi:hypothetical protein
MPDKSIKSDERDNQENVCCVDQLDDPVDTIQLNSVLFLDGPPSDVTLCCCARQTFWRNNNNEIG